VDELCKASIFRAYPRIPCILICSVKKKKKKILKNKLHYILASFLCFQVNVSISKVFLKQKIEYLFP